MLRLLLFPCLITVSLAASATLQLRTTGSQYPCGPAGVAFDIVASQPVTVTSLQVCFTQQLSAYSLNVYVRQGSSAAVDDGGPLSNPSSLPGSYNSSYRWATSTSGSVNTPCSRAQGHPSWGTCWYSVFGMAVPITGNVNPTFTSSSRTFSVGCQDVLNGASFALSTGSNGVYIAASGTGYVSSSSAGSCNNNAYFVSPFRLTSGLATTTTTNGVTTLPQYAADSYITITPAWDLGNMWSSGGWALAGMVGASTTNVNGFGLNGAINYTYTPPSPPPSPPPPPLPPPASIGGGGTPSSGTISCNSLSNCGTACCGANNPTCTNAGVLYFTTVNGVDFCRLNSVACSQCAIATPTPTPTPAPSTTPTPSSASFVKSASGLVAAAVAATLF